MEPITIYLNALVDMLNENPPTSLAALEANLTPFKVLGYNYSISNVTTSNGLFCIEGIRIYNDSITYILETIEELDGTWDFWSRRRSNEPN